ncbi:hypothetical protein D1BOALGB6SA_1419 [Olavius sp. associated proteobacterium Delta 1]|nr:hypothetical protein D1BOALGB6SA_1419 [Olavius sp. associated proteobacterium Delta 1]
MANIFISYTRDDRSRVEPLGAVALIVILSVIGWFLYSKPSYAKTFKNSIGMEFVLISAGSYTMGGDLSIGKALELSSHTVKISRPFFLQKTEVTQGRWSRVPRRQLELRCAVLPVGDSHPRRVPHPLPRCWLSPCQVCCP